jgi:hypothetical protein
LYYPSVDASNYDFILSDVMTPIQQLLCDNYFYLITSRVNGDSICPNAPEGDNFNMNGPYFGDPNYSVLMEVPIFVDDTSYEDTHWMSWTVAFYVVQMGQPVIEMAQVGDDAQEISDQKLSQVMNDVLRLALQVSIKEGDMDGRLAAHLPGAHISLQGEEFSSWSPYGIFSKDKTSMTTSSSHHLPQHQLYQDRQQKSSESSHSPQPIGPSIVATAMMESHRLRHVGIGMFATMLFFLFSLKQLVRLCQTQRGKLSELQQRKSQNIQLATADDVSVLLKVGNRHMEER